MEGRGGYEVVPLFVSTYNYFKNSSRVENPKLDPGVTIMIMMTHSWNAKKLHNPHGVGGGGGGDG